MQTERNPVRLPWASIGLAALIMIIASCAAFGASVSYGFLTFDDSYLVVNNLAVRGPTPANLWRAFTSYDPELYIPLTLVSYQLNYLLAGLHPAFWHFTNLVLHGLNASLVSCIAYLLLRERRIALFTGLLFAVHPLNTEAAVWVAARKDLLSTLFLFGSIALFLRSRESGTGLTASIALYACAALSKSSVITLPLVLPVLVLLKEGRVDTKRLTRDLWPYALIAGATGIVALFGKARVVGSVTAVETVLMAAKSTVFYLEKIVRPLDLTVIYPYQKAITLASPDFFVPLVVLGLLFGAAAMLYRRTSWPLLSLLLFVLTIAPSYLNFQKGSQTFFAVDRYAYAGMIWILILLSAVAALLTERRSGRVRLFLAAAVIGLLGWASAMQTAYWKHDIVLLERTLSLYPESVAARTGLSAAYREAGMPEKEEQVLQDGLTYSDDIALILGLGSVRARQGRTAEAETLYLGALSGNPDHPEPYFYLGSLREAQGDPDAALEKYLKAASLDPSYTAAFNNAGAILLDQEKYAEAEEMYRSALEWNPDFFEARYNLFQVLELQKRGDEAFPHLEIAYSLNPDIPDVGLSYAYRLSERGRTADAVRVLRHVLSVQPENRTALRMLEQLRP